MGQQLPMQNKETKESLYSKYYSVITNNVNVSKTNDLKEFFRLLCGLVLIFFLIFFISDIFSNIFINSMSDETQLKIESMLGEKYDDYVLDKKYQEKFDTLKRIRETIIQNDSEMQNKSKFPIIIVKHDMINAWIVPNGTIRVTTSLLNENLSEEEMFFVLAHEIGHYKHRDHLRTLSRRLILKLAFTITFHIESQDFNKIAESVSKLENIRHTRTQERNADNYASEMSIKVYGNNNGGIQLMKKIDEKRDYPEFLDYISDHPSNNDRIKQLRLNQAKHDTGR